MPAGLQQADTVDLRSEYQSMGAKQNNYWEAFMSILKKNSFRMRVLPQSLTLCRPAGSPPARPAARPGRTPCPGRCHCERAAACSRRAVAQRTTGRYIEEQQSMQHLRINDNHNGPLALFFYDQSKTFSTGKFQTQTCAEILPVDVAKLWKELTRRGPLGRHNLKPKAENSERGGNLRVFKQLWYINAAEALLY